MKYPTIFTPAMAVVLLTLMLSGVSILPADAQVLPFDRNLPIFEEPELIYSPLHDNERNEDADEKNNPETDDALANGGDISGGVLRVPDSPEPLANGGDISGGVLRVPDSPEPLATAIPRAIAPPDAAVFDELAGRVELPDHNAVPGLRPVP